MEEGIECDGFIFFNNFDSANLARVEKVEINSKYNKTENDKNNETNKAQKSSLIHQNPNYEFNIWTKHDCHGTEFQNNNKTWFYFGIKAPKPNALVKFNLVNLNKQVKMFSQGMCPVYRVIPGHPQWARLKEKPTFIADDKNNEFILSFTYHSSENLNAIFYFAFTYPFSYTDLQNYLKKIDIKVENMKQSTNFVDDIYYHRECAIKSLEGRRLDILTISSYYNISTEKEANIKDLFTEKNEERPFKFRDKKIIFLSARVHPGETPSSFVLNGFLNLLLNRDDQIAIILRRLYVFKLIPMLNPDGVAQGYYRMDTKGVNLNRLYLNPSKEEHPTIYAAKALLRYYHSLYLLPENHVERRNKIDIGTDSMMSNTNPVCSLNTTSSIQPISNETNKLLQRVTLMSLEEKGSQVRKCLIETLEKPLLQDQENIIVESKFDQTKEKSQCRNSYSGNISKQYLRNQQNSGIFLYIDFHGHASKKGIFMYGNHFDNPDDSSACMLLPKLMSINNPNFHFTSCNFGEKNMYSVDKRDGMSREGSGRVAVYKLFGLIHSYTLECNYNTGRLVNSVPARVKEKLHRIHGQLHVPPKYNPTVFEEVGAAFGPSILDMTGSNPNSRLPNTQYRSLKGLISYLKLISTNHFQSSLNENSNKNKSVNEIRNSLSSAKPNDKTIIKNQSSSSSSSAKFNRKLSVQLGSKSANSVIYGAAIAEPIKKPNKKITRALNSNAQFKASDYRENKVTVKKNVKTQIKCTKNGRLGNAQTWKKKSTTDSASNFLSKKTAHPRKLKSSIEWQKKSKINVQNTKKSRNFAAATATMVTKITRKTTVTTGRSHLKKIHEKKQAQMLKIRRKFKTTAVPTGESMKKVIFKRSCNPIVFHAKQKNKNNFFNKNQKQSLKTEPKSSSKF